MRYIARWSALLALAGCSKGVGTVDTAFYSAGAPGQVYQLLSDGSVVADSQLFEDYSRLYPDLAAQSDAIIVVTDPDQTDYEKLEKLIEGVRLNVPSLLGPGNKLRIHISMQPIYEVQTSPQLEPLVRGPDD